MITEWIDKNPSAFASLTAAIVAASVAILVFTLTQYYTRKRERTNRLTIKLEELFFSLTQVAENNATFFKYVYLALSGDPASTKALFERDLEFYGHRSSKEIKMMVRLHFPQLSPIVQLLLLARDELNGLVFSLHSEEPAPIDEIVDASGEVGHFIKLTEEEIVRNHLHLVKDNSLFSRYKATTKTEIESKSPRPDGPIMAMAK